MDPRRKIITPKGSRYPGSGSRKGVPRAISVEARVLIAELVNSPRYQAKLREDFEARKVHPTIENMVWNYFIGKPRQDIDVNVNATITTRIEEERRLYAALDIEDLEQLAADSQAFVDRAIALAKGRALPPMPLDVVVDPDLPIVSEESLRNCAGSDNPSSVNQSESNIDVTPNSDTPST